MKNIVSGGFIAAILFVWLASSGLASEDSIVIKPFIGPVRTLIDGNGQNTAFVVPVMPDETVRKQVAQQQEWKKPNIAQYFALLRTESDPNTRRHLLFEVSFATGELAQQIAQELGTMVANEPDEQVRIAYISCLSSLAAQAGLSDPEILKVIEAIQRRMHDDPSWNVKVQTAGTLVWFGDMQGETILQEVIAHNYAIDPLTFEMIPIMLQRLNTATAQMTLRHLMAHGPYEMVKLNALWSAYQLGMIDQAEVLQGVETIAWTSPEVHTKIRAVSTLNNLARENPLLEEQIHQTIHQIQDTEQDANVKQQLFILEQQRKEGQYDCQ